MAPDNIMACIEKKALYDYQIGIIRKDATWRWQLSPSGYTNSPMLIKIQLLNKTYTTFRDMNFGQV